MPQNDQAKALSTDTIKLILIYHILEQLAPLLVCCHGDIIEECEDHVIHIA